VASMPAWRILRVKSRLGLALAVFLACACSALPGSTSTPSNAPGTLLPPSPAVTARGTTPPSRVPVATPTPPQATVSATASPSASTDVVAYTNPDGPDWSDQPPDTYPFIEKAAKLPTYAGLWFDQNQVDVHIALTGDIDGAIEKLGQYVPRGVTVYFQLAPNTKEELCALRDRIFDDREKLIDKGIVLLGGGCGNAQMRVEIDMSPVTTETLAFMRDRYPGPVDYQADGVVPLSNYDPPSGDVRLSAITTTEEADLLTCGQRPFPRSALDQQPVDTTTNGSEFDALRRAFATYSDIFGDLSQQPWILAERDGYGATFLSPRDDGYLEEMVVAGQAGWVPTTLAECQPAQFDVNSVGSAAWALDPAFPAADATSTELHVLVSESACSSGSSPAGRIVPPVVSYAQDTLSITVAVRNVGGIADCPGNPSLPATIVLPEPVGDRRLAGGTDPGQLQ
jgi:hypothetical protein